MEHDNRRSMPSLVQVLGYWNEWMIDTGKALAEETKKELRGRCMACGVDVLKLDRAHILPLCLGGSNDVSNIQNLCKTCHVASEGIVNTQEYLDWAAHRTAGDSALAWCIKEGLLSGSDIMFARTDSDYEALLVKFERNKKSWQESLKAEYKGRLSK